MAIRWPRGYETNGTARFDRWTGRCESTTGSAADHCYRVSEAFRYELFAGAGRSRFGFSRTFIPLGPAPLGGCAAEDAPLSASFPRQCHLQLQFLAWTGTDTQFDKPFFDIGADHIGMVLLQVVQTGTELYEPAVLEAL
jgi:hypothetical protein